MLRITVAENTQTPAHSRRIYDRLAARYDQLMQPLERQWLKPLRRATLAALPAGGRILEIGAGTGLNFSYYSLTAHGVASDPSRAMLERAQEKERPPGVHLIQHSAERLPYREASFDGALATLVFCSVASPTEAFAELKRVVKPGGTIALLEHVRPPGLLGRVFDLLSVVTVRLFDDHFNRRTAEEARRAGLTVQRIEERARGIIQIIVCRV